MSATDRVQGYYDALREGEPLASFFAPVDGAVKVGISERLVGGDAVVEGLTEQTERTTDWSVGSRDLRVTERDRHAWFGDRVSLAWTDTERRIRYEFDTRWTGTLELREAAEPSADSPDENDAAGEDDDPWQFVSMHVSTARDL